MKEEYRTKKIAIFEIWEGAWRTHGIEDRQQRTVKMLSVLPNRLSGQVLCCGTAIPRSINQV